MVFCAYSPAWEGFYISSLGGGAYVMHRVGVDFFCLHGSAPEDSVLILNHNHGQIEARLEPINADLSIDTTDISPGEAANQIILHLESLGYIGAKSVA